METAPTQPNDDITLKKGTINCYFCHTDPSGEPPSKPSGDITQSNEILSDWKLNNKGLFGYEPGEKLQFMSIIPKKVTRHEHDKKILCIEYGPQNGSQCIFLSFESSGDAEEWELAICRLTGQSTNYRNRSETEGTNNPFRSSKKVEHRKTAPPADGFNIKQQPGESKFLGIAEQQDKSQHTDDQRVADEQSLSDVSEPDVSQTPSLRQRGDDITVDTVLNESLETPTLIDGDIDLEQFPELQRLNSTGEYETLKLTDGEDKHWDQSSAALANVDSPSSSILSLPMSLRSQDDGCENDLRNLRRERDECSITVTNKTEDLLKMELKLTEYKNGIYITGWKDRVCNLNVLDRIIQVDSNKPVNESEFQDYIQSIDKKSISMEIQRFPLGSLCAVPLYRESSVTSSNSLGIQLNGSEISEMNLDCVVRQLCDRRWVWFEDSRSNRSITAINDRRVPFDADTEEVKVMMDETIREERILVLQLHPTNFIKELTITSKASDESSLLNPVNRRGHSPMRRQDIQLH